MFFLCSCVGLFSTDT